MFCLHVCLCKGIEPLETGGIDSLRDVMAMMGIEPRPLL